jgi:hypothetical protein
MVAMVDVELQMDLRIRWMDMIGPIWYRLQINMDPGILNALVFPLI